MSSTGSRHIPSKFDACVNENSLNQEQCKKFFNYYRTAEDDEIPRNTKFNYEYGLPRNNSTPVGKRHLDVADTDRENSMTYPRNTKRMKNAASEWSLPSSAYSELMADRSLPNGNTSALQYDEEPSSSNYVKYVPKTVHLQRSVNRESPSFEIENDVEEEYRNIHRELQDYLDRKLEAFFFGQTGRPECKVGILLNGDGDETRFKPSLSDDQVETIQIRQCDITKRNELIIGKLYSCSRCPFVFTTLSMIRDHFEHHLRRGRYNCNDCTYGTNREDDLTDHLKYHDILQGFIREGERKEAERKEEKRNEEERTEEQERTEDEYGFKTPFYVAVSDNDVDDYDDDNNAMASSEFREPSTAIRASEITFSNDGNELRGTSSESCCNFRKPLHSSIGGTDRRINNNNNNRSKSENSVNKIFSECSGSRGRSFLLNDTPLTTGSNKKKVVHPCFKCPARLSSRDCLRRHMLLHGSDAPYKCLRCNYAVQTFLNLRHHEKFHHELSSDQLSIAPITGTKPVGRHQNLRR